MFISILTGHVGKENWGNLQKSYAQAQRKHPHELRETILMQDEQDPHSWSIISIWDNREAYERCKNLGITGTCEQLFCETGSIPNRRTYHVSECYERV